MGDSTMIIEAILKINPKAEVSVNADDINQINWLNGTKPISKQDILDMLPQLELDMALESLRNKRNKLLTETDYLALSDNTMTEEVKTYRQKLRDITEGLTTLAKVKKVKLPTKP
jgi:hypothetical protein